MRLIELSLGKAWLRARAAHAFVVHELNQMATVKLLWFAVERAADPIAASLERVAVRSPGFSKFCVSVARRYNALTSTHRVSLFADEPLAAKEPLSERAATKIGAELLAEAVGASRVRSRALARSRTLSPASQTVVTLGLGVLYDQHRRESEAEDVLEARIATLEAALAARRPD